MEINESSFYNTEHPYLKTEGNKLWVCPKRLWEERKPHPCCNHVHLIWKWEQNPHPYVQAYITRVFQWDQVVKIQAQLVLKDLEIFLNCEWGSDVQDNSSYLHGINEIIANFADDISGDYNFLESLV